MEFELRPFWRKYFQFDWKFGLFLILIVCIPRFLLVLHANETANYRYIGMVMLASAIAPYLFLTKFGRRKIGILGTNQFLALFLIFFFGIFCSLLFHFSGESVYGSGVENWFVYIGRSYNIPAGIAGRDKAIMFAIMAGTGMIFSPIGEELFFRGIVHSSFKASLGEKKASYVDSAAFALTHLSHFGLVYIDSRWQLLLVPGLTWVIGMFLMSTLFIFCKRVTGSLLGAIFCHAGFNLGMIYIIFYLL